MQDETKTEGEAQTTAPAEESKAEESTAPAEGEAAS